MTSTIAYLLKTPPLISYLGGCLSPRFSQDAETIVTRPAVMERRSVGSPSSNLANTLIQLSSLHVTLQMAGLLKLLGEITTVIPRNIRNKFTMWAK